MRERKNSLADMRRSRDRIVERLEACKTAEIGRESKALAQSTEVSYKRSSTKPEIFPLLLSLAMFCIIVVVLLSGRAARERWCRLVSVCAVSFCLCTVGPFASRQTDMVVVLGYT